MDVHSRKKRIDADRAMILEMIEAAMELSRKKGAHSLTPGCNCIVCVNKRKQILYGAPKPWRYRL
ncbi:MAG: hypothetical protein ACQERN_10825 [Thermodesulfobacteriota bacterium]